jgi:SAM-dependent methyltransferase
MHHIPDAYRFFAAASRCLRPGGKLLMIEPWLTSWSRFVYRQLHPEAFAPEAPDWPFASTGPLSGANTALPWMVFGRDRSKFEAEFPEFAIERIRPMLPFRYLVSGGVSMRSLMPGFTHSAWKAIEGMLQPQMEHLGTFAFIALVRG